jgi:Tol biopolymer transport system component
VKTVPDGQEQRLTTDQHDDEPRWSASGTWIAFRHRTSSVPAAGAEVAVLVADGAARRTLGSISRGRDVWWSPTADQLAFIEGDHAVVVDATGEHRVELPDATSVAWSPDGAWLAYVQLETLAPATGGQPPKRRASLWRVRSDGTDAQLVLDAGSPSPEFLVLAGWSPDGGHILFWTDLGSSASGMAGGAPLQAIPASGGARVTIVPTMLAYPDFLAWAPNGSQLALVQGGRRTTWVSTSLAFAGLTAPLRDLGQEASIEHHGTSHPDRGWQRGQSRQQPAPHRDHAP